MKNFTFIGSGVWAKTLKNWNFTNIIAPAPRLQNLRSLCVSSVYITLPNLAALAQ